MVLSYESVNNSVILTHLNSLSALLRCSIFVPEESNVKSFNE
nr:MAG TPA: hypothetical protein [Caudoviricetes sp.]